MSQCPECGAPVRDGGVWLDMSPRIEYAPSAGAPVPSERAVEAATGYVARVVKDFLTTHGVHGGPLVSVVLNFEDGSHEVMGHEIQRAVARLVDALPSGAPEGVDGPAGGGARERLAEVLRGFSRFDTCEREVGTLADYLISHGIAPSHPLTGEDVREAVEEIHRLTEHGIPVYAYGDNEAACALANRLADIAALTARLERGRTGKES